jgi:hypothetical protein
MPLPLQDGRTCVAGGAIFDGDNWGTTQEAPTPLVIAHLIR